MSFAKFFLTLVDNWCKDYTTTQVPWTICHYVRYFQKCWNFPNFISSNSKDIVKENNEYLGNISFVEMDISKLINYSNGHVLKWPRYYSIVYVPLNTFQWTNFSARDGVFNHHIMFFSLEHSWKWSLINRSLLVQKVLHNTYGHFRSMGIFRSFSSRHCPFRSLITSSLFHPFPNSIHIPH